MMTSMMTLPPFSQIGTHIAETFSDELGANDAAFARRVYSQPLEVYRDRLAAVGMLDHEMILDAGCGFGQWMLAMKNSTNVVHGIDELAVRIEALNEVVDWLKLTNVQANQGKLTAIDSPDNSYTAIFCYAALVCTPWREVLQEFARVLRPGGRVYVTVSEIGLYVNLWCNRPNATADYEPRRVVAHTLANTLAYESDGTPPMSGEILIAREDARACFEDLGFTVLSVAGDGQTNFIPHKVTPKPFFQSEYMGLPGCYEIVADLKAA